MIFVTARTGLVTGRFQGHGARFTDHVVHAVGGVHDLGFHHPFFGLVEVGVVGVDVGHSLFGAIKSKNVHAKFLEDDKIFSKTTKIFEDDKNFGRRQKFSRMTNFSKSEKNKILRLTEIIKNGWLSKMCNMCGDMQRKTMQP